jgi:hypothetical protein
MSIHTTYDTHHESRGVGEAVKMAKKFLTGVRRDRPRNEDEPRPLWGDHWNLGSFWDALLVVRSRIETAARALADSDADVVGIMLDDTAEELRRLAARAHEELDERPSMGPRGGGNAG